MRNLLIIPGVKNYSKVLLLFVVCCFASCSKDQEVLNPKDIPFDSKTYNFANQDPGSIAARKAIDSKVKGKGARTINYNNKYANYGFQSSGYIYGVFNQLPDRNTYRQSAYVQNYLDVPMTVEIELGGGWLSNISTSYGSTFYQNTSRKYIVVVPANTSTWTSFDFNVGTSTVESYALINVVSPVYTPSTQSGSWENDWVYPIGFR